MKAFKIIVLLFFFNFIFWGCSDDYLDVAPSKSQGVVPNKIQDIEGLLNNYSSFAGENANELIYSTDDFVINPEYFDTDISEFSTPVVQEYTWSTEFTKLNTSTIWNGEWKKIFTANLVLEALDIVNGDEEEKINLRAEAHFIRAYSYFLLATTYCLPLSGNESEMGLPIKKSTSYEEPLARASLQDTYNFISSDLDEALKIKRNLETVNGLKRIWRASTVSVNGFAARYYLALHDYEKAKVHAQLALDEYNMLRDFNVEVGENTYVINIDEDGNPQTQETATIYTPLFLNNSSGLPNELAWGESYYNRLMNSTLGQFWPSNELLNIYNKESDLRYRYLMIENESYRRGSNGLNPNNPLFSQIGYSSTISINQIISGPSVPEMYLIKSECQVRQGDFIAGLATVNVLRNFRFENTAPANVINLSANSKDEALVKILEERRRELPFVLRWYDLKRYNSNDNPSDDINQVSRTFYPFSQVSINNNEPLQDYTLTKDDRRYAHPIPEQEIISSGGTIIQNEY